MLLFVSTGQRAIAEVVIYKSIRDPAVTVGAAEVWTKRSDLLVVESSRGHQVVKERGNWKEARPMEDL